MNTQHALEAAAEALARWDGHNLGEIAAAIEAFVDAVENYGAETATPAGNADTVAFVARVTGAGTSTIAKLVVLEEDRKEVERVGNLLQRATARFTQLASARLRG